MPLPDKLPPPVERETIYEGKKFDFERVTFEHDGDRHTKEVVRHPGACVILPILEAAGAGRPATLVLIRNERPVVERTLWEIPAGMIDAGEEPEACAARELIEETGYEAATLRGFGRFYTSPAMTDEVGHLFIATGLTEVGQDLDEGEKIEVHTVKADRAIAMIADGTIVDAKTIAGVLRAWQEGLLGVGVASGAARGE